jgi:hypothetical protein
MAKSLERHETVADFPIVNFRWVIFTKKFKLSETRLGFSHAALTCLKWSYRPAHLQKPLFAIDNVCSNEENLK